jgi:hypothetical protein
VRAHLGVTADMDAVLVVDFDVDFDGDGNVNLAGER